MIKIFIADDHPLIREGFKKIIDDEMDMCVVGEARDGIELMSLIENTKADILLLDLKMPGKSGFSLLKDLKLLFPDLLILIVSMLPENQYAVRTLKAGANGYLNKTTAIYELIRAIRSIINRGKYLSKEIAELLFDEIDNINADLPHKSLSNREFQIMRLIASGNKVREIAETLSISISTVNSYRYRIMRKMNLKSNVDLTRYTIENKLI